MYLWCDPLRDQQEQPTVGTCARCGHELYGDEEDLCMECRNELSRYDERTVDSMLEAVDYELKKYMSDELRNKVWNALVTQFTPGAAG